MYQIIIVEVTNWRFICKLPPFEENMIAKKITFKQELILAMHCLVTVVYLPKLTASVFDPVLSLGLSLGMT